MGLTLGYLCFLLVIMYVTNLFTGFVCHATAGGLARNAMLFVKKAQSPSFNKFSKAWNAQSRDKKKCVSATQVDDGWMCMHTYIWLISALATRWPPNMSMLSFARLASRPSSCWMTQQVTAATECLKTFSNENKINRCLAMPRLQPFWLTQYSHLRSLECPVNQICPRSCYLIFGQVTQCSMMAPWFADLRCEALQLPLLIRSDPN